ncbi:VCBS repeat-containing protein [soil metagenome]
MKLSRSIFAALLSLLFYSCNTKKPGADDFHFTLMDASHTNIDFNNKLTENDAVNFLNDQYIYIGAGVGAGDFNNDGLQDLFFAGGQVSSKLYINKGNFEFEDVTERAGLKTDEWCTGVSVVDINNDGLSDIYVCVSHAHNPEQRRNLLFINKGNLKFSEEAKEYGLDDPGFSTQAAFVDYDKDGDLDMYLMNHKAFQREPNNIVQDGKTSFVAADKLYRNEGTPPGRDHPVFKDVSEQAGIMEMGYGLGLSISDFNNDGWPDIYVANDFVSNDLLWLNNKNGSFTNCISNSIRHQSFNSMGADAADINNDALPDMAVLDMQPETNYRKKTMFSGNNPEQYEMATTSGGYQPEFIRNMLQLNNGNTTFNNSKQPFFSEIGQLSGISETDWSWSILMADFDNDGWKDVHITNGLAKDITNNDFLSFRYGQNNGGLNNNGAAGNTNSSQSIRRELDTYGSIKIDNYFYHNNGNLTFSNITEATGLDVPSISHGAVYVDLDNDGDLDMVTNNMNQQAFIWKNEIRKTVKDSINNFLTLQLKGSELNKSGIGAKATLYAKGSVQFLEQYPVRGYMSSVDNRLHFGVGKATEIDSLKIVWPDNKVQLLKHIKTNQTLTIDHKDAQEQPPADSSAMPTLFADVSKELNIQFKHNELSFFDYANQRLLPQKYSQLGPALATGDVNGDGLSDFFVGGGNYQSGQIFIQNNNGTFSSSPLLLRGKMMEDANAVFFDADGDKDLDLLVTEGSLEFGSSTTSNRPQLYKNDGHGNFSLDEDAIPARVNSISQVIAVADYDADGDMDIFIGGRILAEQYPVSPRSYILQNNGGKFTDVTKEVCPALEKPGMITGAVWSDFDNDKKPDLVLCGEWMPLRFFKNINNTLQEVTENTGLINTNGLWRSLQAADIDKDGDMDFIAGNMGLNNKYHASHERPMMLYAKDIDVNGSIDLIPAYYIKNDKGLYELFPAIDRTQFAEEVPYIKKKYLLNKDYAVINVDELFKIIDQKDMLVLKCETTATVWIENIGNGHFKMHQLPLEAQIAPVNAIVANDFDHDGNMDLLLGGNEYQTESATGRYDASYGQFLKGDGRGLFTSVKPTQSGFIVSGDMKNLKTITNKKQHQFVLAAVNNDSLKCFEIKPPK